MRPPRSGASRSGRKTAPQCDQEADGDALHRPAARDLYQIYRPVANAASGRGRKNRHGRAIRDAKRELREAIYIEQSEAAPPGDTPQGT